MSARRKCRLRFKSEILPGRPYLGPFQIETLAVLGERAARWAELVAVAVYCLPASRGRTAGGETCGLLVVLEE